MCIFSWISFAWDLLNCLNLWVDIFIFGKLLANISSNSFFWFFLSVPPRTPNKTRIRSLNGVPQVWKKKWFFSSFALVWIIFLRSLSILILFFYVVQSCANYTQWILISDIISFRSWIFPLALLLKCFYVVWIFPSLHHLY